MRIPSFLMRQKVEIKPFLGSGAYGPIYGDPYQIKCRIESKRSLVRDREGNEVVSEARVYFPHNISLETESSVTWNSREYKVINSIPHFGLNKVSHVEVILR
jgi:hypothetical protein